MTVNAESRMKQGRTRKRVVVLALFAIAIAFYAGSMIVMFG